jgi:hypothetical protein
MTESELLACTYLGPACDAVRSKVSSRKMRLFEVAGARRVWTLLPDDDTRQAIEVAELFADGQASREALDDAARRAKEAADRITEPILRGVALRAAEAARLEYSPDRARQQLMAIQGYYLAYGACQPDQTPRLSGLAVQFAARLECEAASGVLEPADAYRPYFDLLRDVVGPLPFRTVELDPACLTGNVLAIARHIYGDRAFHDLPILADAIEDAGCTDADLLAHCRSAGPHVRGCWAVDLLLGKT